MNLKPNLFAYPIMCLIVALSILIPRKTIAQTHPTNVFVVTIRTSTETADTQLNLWTKTFKDQGFYTKGTGNIGFMGNHISFLYVVVPANQSDAFLTTYSEDARLSGVFNAPTFSMFFDDNSADSFGTADSKKIFDPISFERLKELLMTPCEDLLDD